MVSAGMVQQISHVSRATASLSSVDWNNSYAETDPEQWESGTLMYVCMCMMCMCVCVALLVQCSL